MAFLSLLLTDELADLPLISRLSPADLPLISR